MRPNYTPPYITILIAINLINILFSAYFIALFLIGVVFKIFLESLRKEHYYILTFVICTFLVIEVTQGFKLFSLSIISLVLYYFIIPRIKHLFSSSIIAEFIFILSFYISLFIVIYFLSGFDSSILLIFLYNFIIDSLIVGFIL